MRPPAMDTDGQRPTITRPSVLLVALIAQFVSTPSSRLCLGIEQLLLLQPQASRRPRNRPVQVLYNTIVKRIRLDVLLQQIYRRHNVYFGYSTQIPISHSEVQYNRNFKILLLNVLCSGYCYRYFTEMQRNFYTHLLIIICIQQGGHAVCTFYGHFRCRLFTIF